VIFETWELEEAPVCSIPLTDLVIFARAYVICDSSSVGFSAILVVLDELPNFWILSWLCKK
jgi:hypothetical protein